MRRGILILIALLGALPVQAQEALVLSGGAARGLAHGGVLVGLERRGHDPEIVVGASMGAVIGALYAAGCDAEAVQAIVREQRWRDLFTPLPVVLGPARELRDPILRLQSGRGSGLAARGYLSDWRVNRELVRRLFDPAARAGGDFDRLPRRFRAVATDLATGELVVLTHGDLARAVRASLATPGFFPPVRWQGRYLVDGVLRDYLPVGIAREMGAGTVIASDVIHPNVADTPKADAGYAAERSINWLSVHADRDTSMADGLILPRIDRAPSALVFPTDPSELLQAGLDAALAAPLPEPARRTSKPVRAVPSALTGLQLVDVDPAVSGLLDRSLRGSAYDEARVLRAVDRLYATGLFEGVWPSVEDSSGSSVLYARADVRGRLALLGALGYDNDRGGRAWGTLRRLSSLGSSPLDFALEGSVDGIEKEVSVSARLPGAGRGSPAWSVGGNVSEQTIRSVPELVEEPDVQRAGGWLALDLRQIEPSLYAALAFRAEHVAADAGPDGDSFGPLLRAGEVLGFERPVGLASALELEARFGELDYRRARLRASHAFANRRAAVAPLVCFESVSREAPWDRVPALGDEHLVPGLGWGDRRGRLVTLLGLDASHVVPLWTTLVLRTRAGRVTEGEDWGTVGDEWVGGVAISAYWWLPFGRVELGGSGATTGDRRVDVRLGTEF